MARKRKKKFEPADDQFWDNLFHNEESNFETNNQIDPDSGNGCGEMLGCWFKAVLFILLIVLILFIPDIIIFIEKRF